MGPGPRVQTPGQPSLGRGRKTEPGSSTNPNTLSAGRWGRQVTTMRQKQDRGAPCSKGVLAQGLGARQNILQLSLARKIFRALANALGFLAGVC